MGGDRFIPVRNSKQMDVASFLLTKENEPVDANDTAVSSVSELFTLWSLCKIQFTDCGLLSLKENQKAWSVSLNGYNIEDAKILHLGGKPLNAPEGMDVYKLM